MCNRVTLREPPHDIARILELFNIPLTAARFNIAPTSDLLIFRRAGDAYEACTAHWGLQPSWLMVTPGSAAPAMFNARSETADTKPAFRQAFRERRCLIPVDGFYEWKTEGKRKLPYHFTLRNGKPFAFAGLYEAAKTEPPQYSCTILTTPSNQIVRPLHDRMPVIMDPKDYARWLDPKLTDKDELKSLLKPFPSEQMSAKPVNPYVNKSGNEGPQCLDTPPPEPKLPGTLFD